MEFLDLTQINEVHVEISSQCLLNCVHCSSYDTIHNNSKPFSFEDLTAFLGSLSKNVHVYITGGEPLLSDRLLDSLECCKSYNLDVGLFTTFNIHRSLDETMYVLKEKGVVDFYLSLYSSIPEEHDKITGVDGSWQKAVNAIRLARNYGILPKINFVLMKNNIKTLYETISNIDKLDIDEIRILKLVNHGQATKNWDIIGVPLIEQYKAVQNIIERRKDFMSKLTFSGFPALEKCRPFKSQHFCGAGKTLLYIDHSGEIFPCASMKNDTKYSLGNLKHFKTLKSLPFAKSKCYKMEEKHVE